MDPQIHLNGMPSYSHAPDCSYTSSNLHSSDSSVPTSAPCVCVCVCVCVCACSAPPPDAEWCVCVCVVCVCVVCVCALGVTVNQLPLSGSADNERSGTTFVHQLFNLSKLLLINN